MSSRVTIPSLIPNEKSLVENGLNVMLIGPHGTGKTESVRALADRYGLKMVAFSCATLDPYTELVGVPMPRIDSEGREYLKMVRPLAIDEADILFFDELNRARPETQNAVFEIINNGTINGEPLPKLKGCWSAINPPGGDYDVDELDPALMDRFDLFLEFKPRPSVAYMATRMDKTVASALMGWWTDHNKSRRSEYISPRRLVKIGKVFEATRDRKCVVNSLPPGGDYDHGKLWLLLQEAVGIKTKTTKDTGLPGVKKRRGPGRTAHKLRTSVEKAVTFHASPATMFRTTGWRQLSELEAALSVKDWENLISDMPTNRVSILRSCFRYAMGEGKGTCYAVDGSRNPKAVKWVKTLPGLHEAINNLTKVRSAKLPPL
jgi:hypothetical protein